MQRYRGMVIRSQCSRLETISYRRYIPEERDQGLEYIAGVDGSNGSGSSSVCC